MQMVPPQLDAQHAKAAERLAFEMLAGLEIPGWTYCFHSLNLPGHQYKRACEIDFLLLGERGLLVLEVKGGGVSCTDGVWQTQTGRGGVHRLSESPFQQAQSARFELERRLQREVGVEVAHRTVFGHGVVFPEVEFRLEALEWAPEMVVDHSDMNSVGFRNALDRLGRYWEQKDERRGALTEVEVEKYRTTIRPVFDLVPGIRFVGRKIERQLHSLTQQQYRVLDECEGNARLIIDGGAGTGKTMLAAELARRAKADGVRVLVTCRSMVLTAFLHRQGVDPEDAIHFEGLSDIRPASVDMLIVDEAQDVINEQDLRTLDRIVGGGLADGRWVMLLDSNNQRGLVGSYEEASMRLLTGDIRAARRRLIDNCRNTTEIVKETQARTAADLGIAPAGHGDPVAFISGTRGEATEAIAEVLARLDSEVSLNDVVLLSPFELRRSIFHSLPDKWRRRVDRLDLMRPGKLESGRIGFAQIAPFKGLESRYIFLEAPSAADPDLTRRLLYVGMTRARAGLWVISPHTSHEGNLS